MKCLLYPYPLWSGVDGCRHFLRVKAAAKKVVYLFSGGLRIGKRCAVVDHQQLRARTSGQHGFHSAERAFVDPTLQGKGIGKQMMKFAEKIAVGLGRKRIELATSKKNLQAISFYKKIGYRIVKEVENYYGEGEIRYMCEKTLPG